MKKFTFFIALNLFVYSAFATDYYLSDDGNDANNGTSIATPWKTLQKLSSELGGPSGTWSELFNSGDRIFFRKGDTFRGTIAFSAWNNGGITFDSYGTGPMPIIKGSSVITNWTIHSGNIWKASVPQTVHFLYVNNLKQTLARTPNTGTWNISASSATSISNSNISSSGENFVGSNICLREYDWRLNRQIITSQSGNNVTWANSINAAGANANFYFDNKLEHLDANNEWFYDTATQTLYLMSAANPNTLFVEGSTNMVGIAGNDNRTDNVIKNLQFEHYADAGITLTGGSHNNQILNCRFINNCNSLHLSGDNAIITNNYIENISVQGMLLANLKDSNVNLNTITNVGLEFGNHRPGFVGDFYSNGIWLINAFNGGCVLAENSITNCGYNGIRYNGVGIMIEKNDIRNTLLNMDDGGAIYTFGSDSYNNTIQNNYIKNVVGDHNGTVPGGIVNGIYIDNLSYSNIIRNNTLEDIGVGSGILINADSHSNTIEGNVTYKCREGITFADWRPGASIYNNSLLNNTFYTNLQNSNPVLILSDDNNYNVFSNSNNNFLCNPYSNNVVRYMWSSNETFTLTQWQTHSGFDAASVGSFYNWTSPVDHSFIVKNQTANPVTTNYTNTVDLNNNVVTTLTLPPFSSSVLISSVNCPNTTWTGNTNNLWNVASNWSCGVVPDGSADIFIARGTPILNVDFTLQSSGTLTLSGTSTLTLSPAASLTISGTTNFAGNLVTLQSDASGTARIGQVTGTLNGATNVIVERFIPAKRAWRLLTAPLRGTANNSIFANWQNNGAAGDNTTGFLLWHPQGNPTLPLTTNGFFLGAQPNVRSYTSGVWSNVVNSNTTPLFTATENNAFLVFVAGPHDSANLTTTAAATTASATGTLVTGTVTESLTANQFKLIGNPYASAIDPAILVNGSSNTGATLWLINPTVGFGAYVTYGNGNWSIPTVGNDRLIQSGQGFFARTAAASTFTINETHKVAGNSNNWFERNASNEAETESVDKIRVLLYKQEASNWTIADGILAVNQASGNNEVDEKDAGKISNFNESLMFRNNTSNISIEYKALPQAGEIQPLRMTNTTAISYQLRVYTEEYTNSTLQPYLQDTTTGALTAIPMDGSEVTVPFAGIVSNSTAPDLRFRIVYQIPLSTNTVTLSNVKVFPNPVVNSKLNINLGSDTTDAQYTITNLLGQSIQKGALPNTQNTITVPAVQQGIYILNISQADQSYTTKIYVQ